MRYFLLNNIDVEQRNDTPQLLRVPESFFGAMNRCIYYNQLAKKLERECLEILSKTNKLTISEVDDLMATNDWGVDQLSYGLNTILNGEITKEEYLKFLQIIKGEKCQKF